MSGVEEVIADLRKMADPKRVKGLARYAIPEENAIGLRLPQLREYARKFGRDQELADLLWLSPIHEVKILATIVADPKNFSIEKADAWMKDLYSWDLCDQFCINVLVKTPYCLELPFRWQHETGEFQLRAPMALIAVIAVHQKKLSDEEILKYLPLLEAASADQRNFVKKAVNWAVRQIGKRNAALRSHMISFCQDLLKNDNSASTWIARDALRELEKRKA